MEIERLGENKIRCALSEEEIQKMGRRTDWNHTEYQRSSCQQGN